MTKRQRRYEKDFKRVDERQNFSIIERGNENQIFKFLYMITMGKIGR
jgi:hypothetical protein